MTRWMGPQGRLWNMAMAGFTAVLVGPMALIALKDLPRLSPVIVTVLLAICMGTLYWAGRKTSADHTDMVYRFSWLPVNELGATNKRTLEEAGIPYAGPFTRPPPDLLHNWIRWEVRIPDEGMRVAAMAGGPLVSVVLVGPATLYNASEVERLKRPVDGALG